MGFGLGAIAFINETLFGRDTIWNFVCFGLAFVPGTIAYGLWQKKRWAYLVVLWSSVLATPLLPILVPVIAALGHAASVWIFVLAGMSGLLAGLIVFFLTRPETKAMFGSPNGAVEEDRHA